MDFVRRFGPYVAIEILLPGGTLVAALLYIARRCLARTAVMDRASNTFAPRLSIPAPAVRLPSMERRLP